MDKELTVPKWVLINRLKIPQMSQNFSALLPPAFTIPEYTIANCDPTKVTKDL